MTLLTIFSAPKPFTNPHINIIQRNAIQSWLKLDDTTVLLIGDEPGLPGAAKELGVTLIPEVARSETGTPLVPSIFDRTRQHSTSPLLCYVNADIILMPDFVEAARRVAAQATEFLMIGKRWDLDIHEFLEFPRDWAAGMRKRARQMGRLHPPAGSDYFVFPRNLFADMPEFSIGRAGWDNWMIYHARQQGCATIDATPDVFIIHQNHDYSHLPGGKPHYDHPESHRNIALARGPANDYTGYMILDTNRELRKGRIVRPRPTLLRLIRRLELALMPKEKSGPRWALTRRLRKLRRRFTGSE